MCDKGFYALSELQERTNIHTYRGEAFPVWLLWESISLQAQLEYP